MSRRERRDADFTRFMEQAGPALLRTAWLLTGNEHQAQELAQAALVKTYVAWPRVREGEALAYARRILVNHRTDTWRSTRREVGTDVTPEPGAVGTDAVTTSDDRDLVVRLLARLPEQQRRVVVLRYYTDLSEQSTAEVLGVSVGAVKSAASRGLAALRAASSASAASADSASDPDGDPLVRAPRPPAVPSERSTR